VKFLCLPCDQQMDFDDRAEPGDGTFGASFHCPKCGHRVAMLANPMETQLVGSLGVEIGGRPLDQEPMEFVREKIDTRDDAFSGAGSQGQAKPRWSAESEARLERVPKFVKGMVKKIYGEWASERGITEITPAVMDEARVDLGLENM